MHHKPVTAEEPLDLSRWRNVPLILLVGGGILSIIGLFARP